MPRNKPAQAKKPRKRAPRGTGTVFFCKRRKKYIARKPVGRRRGRTVYLERLGDTMEAAIRRRDAALPPGPSTTLAEWSARWFSTHELKPASRDAYDNCLKLRILPDLGHLKLTALTPFAVREAAQRWGRRVGAATVRKTLAVLSACLQAANMADAVPRNVARAAPRPKAPRADIDPFSAAELAAIVRAGTENPEWRVFGACAGTGCRIGEASALSPRSYNAVTYQLTISATRTQRHGVGTPKSAASARTVTVPEPARALFAAGVPNVSYSVALRRWPKLLAHLGLRHRNIHAMKHSWASIALAKGAPVADVAKYLGDTVAVLVATYVRPTNYDVAGLMGNAFGGAVRWSKGVGGSAKPAGNAGRKRRSS